MARRHLRSLLVAPVVTMLTVATFSAPAHGRAAGPTETRQAAATTTLTIRAPGCSGCLITASSATTTGPMGSWSASVKVRDGSVTLKVPTSRTRGLTLTVIAPWDALLGYVTEVTMRYGTAQTGDVIGFDRARTENRATACWAGTTQERATLALGIRRVRVRGLVGTVDGTIAWVRTTPEWLEPMRRAPKGVLGSEPGGACVT